MTTKEAGADRRALAAGMIRLLGLSAGYGETNKYVEQPPPKLTVATPVRREVTKYFEVTGPVQPIVSVHIRPEDLAAEFTDALYPQVLRRRPKDRWIEVELALWKALTEIVEACARSVRPVRSRTDSTCGGSASSIARESGIDESLRMLELDLYLAVRLTNGACSFVI